MEPLTFYPKLRSYYKSLVPLFVKRKVVAYTMLVLSFFTIAIFGTFAIRPTLATIVQLRKRISDEKLVNVRMDEKIAKLRSAQSAYDTIRPDLALIFNALPDKPATATLLGKLNRTLIENNIDITILEISKVALTEPESASSASQMEFSLTGSGSYENAVQFIGLLSRIDRILSLDSVDISAIPVLGSNSASNLLGNNVLVISIRGKSYVLWKKTPAAQSEKGEQHG